MDGVICSDVSLFSETLWISAKQSITPGGQCGCHPPIHTSSDTWRRNLAERFEERLLEKSVWRKSASVYCYWRTSQCLVISTKFDLSDQPPGGRICGKVKDSWNYLGSDDYVLQKRHTIRIPKTLLLYFILYIFWPPHFSFQCLNRRKRD